MTLRRRIGNIPEKLHQDDKDVAAYIQAIVNFQDQLIQTGTRIKWGSTTAPDGGYLVCDGTTFVNATYPMAAYPDQVWIDGAAQAQVGSLAAVAAGKFWVDRTNHRLYLGTIPAGRSVRASDLSTAVTLAATNSVLRGVGVRRYATSVPEKGTVVVRAPGTLIENVSIEAAWSDYGVRFDPVTFEVTERAA